MTAAPLIFATFDPLSHVSILFSQTQAASSARAPSQASLNIAAGFPGNPHHFNFGLVALSFLH